MNTTYADPIGLPDTVNHRYRVAKQHAKQQRHMLQGQADRFTRELHKILKGRRATKNENLPASINKDLVRALEIHESEQGSLRSQLQAFLLTELTYEEIAERLKVSREAVVLYMLCFFNVRSDLNDQVKEEVVAAYRSVPAEQLTSDFVWKMVALAGGASMLDEVMLSAEIRTPQDAASASVTEAKSIAQHKIVQAIKAIDPNDPNAIRELRRMLENLDEGQPDNSRDYLLQQIEVMCTSLPFSCGRHDTERTPDKLVELENGSCELNSNELHRVAFCQQLENEDQLLNVRFPYGPDDHDALQICQRPTQEPAPSIAADEVGHVNSANEAFGEVASSQSQPIDSVPHCDVQGDRVEPHPANGDHQSLEREQAPAQTPEQVPIGKDARMQQLDEEWSTFVGSTSGAARNRRWKKFLQRHPGYVDANARKRLKSFGNGR